MTSLAAPPAQAPTLSRLLDGLRTSMADATARATPAERIARSLATCPPTLDVLTAEQGRMVPGVATSRIVHGEDALSVVAIVIGPAQPRPPHLVRRDGHERDRTRDDLHRPRRALAATGESIIHRVRNDAETAATWLHLHGIDVRRTGSSVRRSYALPVRRPKEGIAP